MNPEWKDFELLVASVQRALAPGASVTSNVRIPGRRSGVLRQIDILVEQKAGQFDLRIVIDCKDYKRPVDVKDVEEIIGLVDDVGANKGAIVAANGFTAAAKKRGADAGLDLLRLVDSSPHKWQSYMTAPAVTRDIQLGSFKYRFEFTGPSAIFPPDTKHFPIFRADGAILGFASNLVLDRWEEGVVPKKAGTYSDIPLTEVETFLKGPTGLVRAKVTFSIKVVEVLHFGQIPLTQLSGFRNEVSEVVHTNGFATGDFDFERINLEWTRIESIEQLAIKPLMVLHVSSTYPRYSPADS